jgi:hypothetical protein
MSLALPPTYWYPPRSVMLTAVSAPFLGHLPLALAERWSGGSGCHERADVNLIPSGFVGDVGNPAPVRGKASVAFVERRAQQERGLSIAFQRQLP